jgi:Leucine-rich repeat (LRR) protein
LTLQAGNETVKGISNVPEKDVEKGSEESIAFLKTSGILALPVAANSNYLLISLRGIDPSAKDIEALKSLKKQIVWLNATNVRNVEGMANLFKEFNEIRVLHLNKTNFSDKGMAEIRHLSHLQTLNLSNTEVTEKGLESLKNLKELQKVFLYKSKVKFNLLDVSKFPKLKIDTGGYFVPTFETDTSLVKIPM